MKKYEFTGETKEWYGHTLHQIAATRNFGDVKKGDVGGWIEKENNLSHEDNAWVYGDAHVCNNAWVCGDAQVCGGAQVYNNAQVCDNAHVCGDAQVCDNAQVCGNT